MHISLNIVVNRQWFGRDNNRKHSHVIQRKRNTVYVVLLLWVKVESIEKSGIGLNDYTKHPTPGDQVELVVSLQTHK